MFPLAVVLVLLLLVLLGLVALVLAALPPPAFPRLRVLLGGRAALLAAPVPRACVA